MVLEYSLKRHLRNSVNSLIVMDDRTRELEVGRVPLLECIVACFFCLMCLPFAVVIGKEYFVHFKWLTINVMCNSFFPV